MSRIWHRRDAAEVRSPPFFTDPSRDRHGMVLKKPGRPAIAPCPRTGAGRKATRWSAHQVPSWGLYGEHARGWRRLGNPEPGALRVLMRCGDCLFPNVKPNACEPDVMTCAGRIQISCHWAPHVGQGWGDCRRHHARACSGRRQQVRRTNSVRDRGRPVARRSARSGQACRQLACSGAGVDRPCGEPWPFDMWSPRRSQGLRPSQISKQAPRA